MATIGATPPSPPPPITATKPSMVNLNVREVLEKSSVVEAKEISRKVNLEIERKKEELRMLVGERYRDLIDAADTIGTMSINSISVFEKLTILREKFSSFPSNLVTVKIPKDFAGKRRLNPQEIEIASNLKLLLQVPRATRVSLEKKEITLAVHLSIFYEKVLCSQAKPFKWNFLETSGQNAEETAATIRLSVLSTCENCLRDFNCSNEKLASCLIAKQILGKSSCEKVLEEFLIMRVKEINTALMEKDTNFVQYIATTAKVIYSIFIDPQEYNISCKKMKKPCISASYLGLKASASSLVEFHLQLIAVKEPPRASVLADVVLNHFVHPLKTVLKSASTETGVLMSEEKSFHELHEYRQNISKILKEETDDLMRIVLGTTKTLWGETFHSVFHEKCQQIGGNWVKEIFKFMEQDSFPRFQKLEDSFDLVSFVWKPPGLNEKSNHLNVDLKLNCFSPHMAGLCGELEEQFQELLRDFLQLGDSSIKDFISNAIVEEMKGFFERRLHCVGGGNLFLGKFCFALNELCGTLWKLINVNDKVTLKKILEKKCKECWMSWAEELIKHFKLSLETKMMDLSPYSVASFMPVAEEFVSQGQGEEVVKPSIQVPLQLSHSLHSLLFQICVEIAKVGPQSITKSVREFIRGQLGENVKFVYGNIIQKEKENSSTEDKLIPQIVSQLIFDLKFCQWFHPSLSDAMKPIVEELQGHIDPFDADIVFPRLKDNLKRFLFETHLTLGLLFSEESHSFIAQNFKTKQNQSYPQSSSISTLLPLLPI